MHPFHFTTTLSFTCTVPDSSLVFEPENNNKFHWYGKNLDKLGKYILVEAELMYLGLEWNYAREQTYIIVSNEGVGDTMTGFVLKDTRTQKLYSFFR